MKKLTFAALLALLASACAHAPQTAQCSTETRPYAPTPLLYSARHPAPLRHG